MEPEQNLSEERKGLIPHEAMLMLAREIDRIARETAAINQPYSRVETPKWGLDDMKITIRWKLDLQPIKTSIGSFMEAFRQLVKQTFAKSFFKSGQATKHLT